MEIDSKTILIFFLIAVVVIGSFVWYQKYTTLSSRISDITKEYNMAENNISNLSNQLQIINKDYELLKENNTNLQILYSALQSSCNANPTAYTKCSGVSIDILTVTNTVIIYSNPSSQTITNITFTMSDGTVLTPSSQSLNSGAVASYNFIRGGNTSVTANGLCMSLVSVKGTCTTGESCWS